MEQTKHWQDPVNAALGAWLLLSPFLLDFVFEVVPTASTMLSGLALIVVTFGAMCTPRAWEEWLETLIGLWLIAAPWALGFNELLPAMRASVATGVGVAVLGLWVLAIDKDYIPWLHRRTTH